MEKIRIEQHSLHFWKGVAALFIWPVYMGAAFSPLLQVVTKAQ
jgi:hypothetical protein